jgi:hypothetical protein
MGHTPPKVAEMIYLANPCRNSSVVGYLKSLYITVYITKSRYLHNLVSLCV